MPIYLHRLAKAVDTRKCLRLENRAAVKQPRVRPSIPQVSLQLKLLRWE